jgi:hypothetical protein
VSLKLIYGPPNSGRAGLIRRGFVEALKRDPILVVPNVDDVFAFERELCEKGAVLGGSAMTFGALFRTVAAAAGSPPGAELSPAQRLRAVAVAIESSRDRLGPLRRSAARPRFATALERLFDELQAAGIEPEGVEARPHSPRGDRAAAPRRLLLGRPAGLPLRLRRPDREPVRAGRRADRAD